jgi:DNA-binding NarL/FixJ family response regulator
MAPTKPDRSSPLLSQDPRALKILVVDDHAIVRDGLKQAVADKFPQATCADARNGREALEQLGQSQWDVMLLDITMPGQSGLDVLKQVKVLQPDLKVLVLTMHPEDQYAVRVLKAGAAGYITKESASEELIKAICKVLDGGRYVSHTLAEKLAGALSEPAAKIPHDLLSDRELQVMVLLASGKSVKEISFEQSLSIKTVSTYRARVFEKLNFKSNADLVRYALLEKLIT